MGRGIRLANSKQQQGGGGGGSMEQGVQYKSMERCDTVVDEFNNTQDGDNGEEEEGEAAEVEVTTHNI